MAQTEATTVSKQIVVDTPIEHAFSVFTAQFGGFTPPEHNLLGAPITATVFEPRVGGGIVDRPADGSECRCADPGLRPAGPGGVQLGHQPPVNHRGRPGSDQ